MATILLKDVNSSNGECVLIDNQDPKHSECKHYCVVKVEDLSGEHQWYVVFTAHEMENMKFIDPFELMPVMFPGRLYKVGVRESFFIRIKRQALNGSSVLNGTSMQEGVIKVPFHLLERASMRSDKNVKDNWQKGFWKDLYSKNA